MTIFEYVSVMASIILALGIAQLLTGLGRLLVSESRRRPYWVHSSWLVTLALAHVQVWWQLWFRYNVPTLRFSQFVFVLAGPATRFLAAFVLMPGGFPQDAESHFYRVRRPFFAVVFLAVLSSALGPFFHDLVLPAGIRAAELLALGLAALGFLSSDRRLHCALAVASLAFAGVSLFVPQIDRG
jgi:hypothetical protein